MTAPSRFLYGLPDMYMIGNISGSRQPLWYGGALTFPQQQGFYFDGFDRLYSRDDAFVRQFAALEDFIAKGVEAGVECCVVFACHPVQVMSRGWIEHYTLTTGKARTPRELGWHYAVKLRAEEAAAQANFRKLCVYLKEHPALKVVGIEEAARLFSAQPAAIGRDALVAYAADVVRTGEPTFHPVFSPAELLCGLADSLVVGAAAGDLSESVARRTVLGPVERPVVAQERDSVTAAGARRGGRVRRALRGEVSRPPLRFSPAPYRRLTTPTRP